MMKSSGDAEEKKPEAMQRLALSLVQPGMVLARDVYDQEGTIMVSAGTALTQRLISRLGSREILSVFVRNPRIELPPISPAVQEATRNRARLMVEHAFNVIRRAEQFSMSEEEQQTVHSVVETVTQDPRALIHMAHIDRNSRDIMSHSVNVSLLSTATALSMGIKSADPLHELALSALLHDIGLLMIPQDLIVRRTSLSSEEAAIYREHTNWGYAILEQAANLPASIAQVALEHHENADGTGYPSQLTGNSLHPFSRIVSAVNAYENLCAGGSDCKGNQANLAYEAIMAGAGTRFDLKVAKALLSRLPMYPTGSVVKLTNGFVGLVVSASQDMPHRPKIKILATADEIKLETPFLLDLVDLENQTLFVENVLNDEEAAQFTPATD
jgi:HD-GYP domain-containing protein (c-di-GMP phosphodiesterase class II)